jgi:K+-sensing histidine kinase KdpD
MFMKRRSNALGIAVGAGLVAAETIAVVLLMEWAPKECFESLYLLGVLVISMMWGRMLAMGTSVASALALAYFHGWPSPRLLFDLENAVIVGVFLVVALLTNLLASAARARAVDAAQGRHETEVLATQQAALRRVATLVWHAVSARRKCSRRSPTNWSAA